MEEKHINQISKVIIMSNEEKTQNIFTEEESLSELLQKAESHKSLDELCVNIFTTTDQYNLCFIEFETKNHLGVYCTHSDGTERFVLLTKKYITSISIVYQQDINVDIPNVSEFS